MELTEHQEPTSTLQRKSGKSRQNPDLAMPKNKKRKGLLEPSERKNRAAKSRKQRTPEQQQPEPHDSQHREETEREDGEESDRAEVERKIVALQRIVPGGEELGVDTLFEETAEYILSLQCQVKSMRALTSFFEGLERNKRKLGC
ncbi:transcription factor PAR1-like [Punica granatum]|uniref:Uncharacterized protein n=2 Tax=Punica granatum TaxID=22663 RepID=A0A218WMR7_PUNGR|nr:transcription factor PAR1-like [Punica granatum]OWM73302.1 hypothetical protein CDL15_Pgr001416 [Punica granatum]PKI55680.1 hypothetical protein CRG98_023896 [Punica granatum]